MSKTLPSRDEQVHPGRPKGIPTVHVQRMLDAWEKPPLDPAVAEALDDFVRRRKAELPDAVT